MNEHQIEVYRVNGERGQNPSIVFDHGDVRYVIKFEDNGVINFESNSKKYSRIVIPEGFKIIKDRLNESVDININYPSNNIELDMEKYNILKEKAIAKIEKGDFEPLIHFRPNTETDILNPSMMFDSASERYIINFRKDGEISFSKLKDGNGVPASLDDLKIIKDKLEGKADVLTEYQVSDIAMYQELKAQAIAELKIRCNPNLRTNKTLTESFLLQQQ